jgi:hypothetical protein
MAINSESRPSSDTLPTPFPYLAVSSASGVVILVTGSTDLYLSGVVVHCKSKQGYTVGQIRANWGKPSFSLYKGEVTLNNE